jgi:hypothetical protein
LVPFLTVNDVDHCAVSLSWNYTVPTYIPTFDGTIHNRQKYSIDDSPIFRSSPVYRIFVGDTMLAEVSGNTYTHTSSHPTHPVICGGTEYEYKIMAVFTELDHERESNGVSATLPTTHQFNAPQVLSVDEVGSGSVTLSWTEPEFGYCGTLSNYSLFFGIENPPTENHQITTDTSMTVFGLVNGTTYFFAVRANYTNHTGVSPRSNTVFAMPGTTSEFDIEVIPVITELRSNYPNPFNPVTTIRFSIENVRNVNIDVYNVRGQRVRTLVNGVFATGSHVVVWNGTDDNGYAVSSGIYFYRMTAGEYSAVRKMILLK